FPCHVCGKNRSSVIARAFSEGRRHTLWCQAHVGVSSGHLICSGTRRGVIGTICLFGHTLRCRAYGLGRQIGTFRCSGVGFEASDRTSFVRAHVGVSGTRLGCHFKCYILEN
ncbi:unnamed protein product, partial [Ectocarpus sp. 12 AP-2014]